MPAASQVACKFSQTKPNSRSSEKIFSSNDGWLKPSLPKSTHTNANGWLSFPFVRILCLSLRELSNAAGASVLITRLSSNRCSCCGNYQHLAIKWCGFTTNQMWPISKQIKDQTSMEKWEESSDGHFWCISTWSSNSVVLKCGKILQNLYVVSLKIQLFSDNLSKQWPMFRVISNETVALCHTLLINSSVLYRTLKYL